MKHPRLAHGVAVVSVLFFAFLIRSCRSPDLYRDEMGIGEITAAPRIQVGLMKFYKVPSARISVGGPYALLGAKGILERRDSLEPGEIRVVEGKTVIGKDAEIEEVLRLSPERDSDLQVGGTRYHGDLLVLRDGDRVQLVNEVDLESYLKGVVGKEMSLSADEKALKAQVICARTYAMYEVRNQTLRRVKGEKFDVYDDERSQVYGGMERETELASRLVDETRGMFVVWEGRIIKTYFSSTCGGATEPAWKILGEGDQIPPLAGTRCEYCKTSRHYSWTAEFSKADLAKKLYPDDPRAKVKAVRVTKTLPGGHAWEMGITRENSSKETILPANDGFRRKIDPRQIRSTLFESIEDRGEKIAIHGRGWGHGAGMCQTGAYNLAKEVDSAAKIIEYYFPQAEVRKLY